MEIRQPRLYWYSRLLLLLRQVSASRLGATQSGGITVTENVDISESPATLPAEFAEEKKH